MKFYGRHEAHKSISPQSTRKRPSRCGAPETVDPKSTSSSGGINQISVVWFWVTWLIMHRILCCRSQAARAR